MKSNDLKRLPAIFWKKGSYHTFYGDFTIQQWKSYYDKGNVSGLNCNVTEVQRR